MRHNKSILCQACAVFTIALCTLLATFAAYAQSNSTRTVPVQSLRSLNYSSKNTQLRKTQPTEFQRAETPVYSDSEGAELLGGGICNSFAGGPYTDQAIDVAGCNGTSISAPYAAWLNEVYFTSVIAGGNYTFSICNGYSATAWGGAVYITAILNGTQSGPPPGTITGGTQLSTNSPGCSITFTAPQSGTVFFILSTLTACGGAILQVDNGIPTITTNSGVACTAVCGNTTCDLGETYCSCASDCPCSISSAFVAYNETTQTFQTSTTPTAYCENFVTGDVNPALPAHVMYIPLAVVGVSCVTQYNISTTQGTLYKYSGDTLAVATTIGDLTVFWLKVTQANITASGGTTTVTMSGGSGACVTTKVINWASVANYTGSVDVTCKSALVVGMFLEGAYNTTSGDTTMRTDINTLIPLNSPYSVAPWNAPAASIATMPTAVVDWVLVELRNPTTNVLVESQVGLLSKFGYVYDADLNLGLTFNATGNYAVIVRHRNHLPVISSVAVDPDGTLLDFALAQNILGGEPQLSRLGTLNLFGLKAGDTNANGIISRNDFNVFKQAGSLLNTYNNADCNMDKNVSQIGGGDFPLIRQNTSTIGPSQVRY